MILRGIKINLFYNGSKFWQQPLGVSFNLHLIAILQNNRKNVHKAESYWFSSTKQKYGRSLS